MVIKHNKVATPEIGSNQQVNDIEWNEDHIIEDNTFSIAKTTGLQTALTATITAGVDLVCIIEGRFLCTANGTFAPRVASELANNDIVIQIGSWGTWF